MLAGAERFLVEFVRAKSDRLTMGLTLAQFTALALVATGAVLWTMWSKREEVPPGEYLLRGKPAKAATA
jgi:prolipoprotein diacylglyceryltransferase